MLFLAPAIKSALSSGILEAIASPREPGCSEDVSSSAIMELSSGISKKTKALSYLRRSPGGQSNALSLLAASDAAAPELKPRPALAAGEEEPGTAGVKAAGSKESPRAVPSRTAA